MSILIAIAALLIINCVTVGFSVRVIFVCALPRIYLAVKGFKPQLAAAAPQADA